MIFWRTAFIEDRAAARGWSNPRQLAQGAGIRYGVAWEIRNGAHVERLHTPTAEKLADALGCDWRDLYERRS